MPLSPAARRATEATANRRIAALKDDSIEKIRRIQSTVEPPLRGSELSLGLDLERATIGRILSEKPRSRRVVPDEVTRAALDALVAGELLLAVGPPVEGRRPVLVCARDEVARLARSWAVYDVTGRPVERGGHQHEDWEVAQAWDMFGDAPPPTRSASLDPIAPRSTPRPVGHFTVGALGLGCMRLSTAGRPEEATAVEVLQAAYEAGVRLFDTADVYAVDEHDLGHNERLVARAVGGLEGVLVATKAGLRRRGRRWLPDGRPEHLRAACEASLRALGVERIDLYQLHAVDRRVPLEESVGALAELRAEGKVRDVGLCNVDLEQLERARAVVPVVSVQNKANPFDTRQLRGVLERCAELDIAFLAHSPAGGWRGFDRITSEPALTACAQRHGVDPRTAALAWLLDLAPHVVALPGATRVETVRSIAAAGHLTPTAEDRSALDRRFSFGPKLRAACAPPPELVVVMGIPAAGKTRHVEPHVARGFVRLNRDEVGGRLDDLVPHFEQAVKAGARRFVADNTYPTRGSRASLLEAAARHGIPARCVWLDVPLREARINATLRLLERTGKLLSPDELRTAGRTDPNLFPPQAQLVWLDRFEEPSEAEGFVTVERVGFERRWGPEHTERALVLDYDGTLRRTKSGAVYPTDPDDVEVLPGRTERLRALQARGFRLLGLSNQSGVHSGRLTEAQARACFERTNELLGLDIEYAFCPHPSGRPKCWCRKPMPGWGVRFTLEHRLDPARCWMVGDLESDEAFAAACGFRYVHPTNFFDPEHNDLEAWE